MRTKSLIAALLLVAASLQTATAQGFRVYKSDGTFTQFSFRTDSIVFYEGAGEDVEFGPFTPVNQIVVGKWYKNHNEMVNFNEDGTTDYYSNGIYEYIPYQSEILVYNSSKVLKKILRVHKVTAEQMVVSTLGSTSFSVWTTTQPPQLVTSIILNETFLNLHLGETRELTATVLPDDANNKAVTWKSSNSDVATVDGKGLVTAIADGNCTITCTAKDGSGVKANCEVKVSSHEYVDLGLPSGTLWATCNVGANSPEEYGDYFAWGETEPKEDYSLNTYKFYDTTYQIYTKYCTDSTYGTIDNKTELEPEDDAATVNWGSDWQIPSKEQLEELINTEYTTRSKTTLNGVDGMMIVSNINGKRIFIPYAGSRNGTEFHRVGGVNFCWSRTLGDYGIAYAYHLYGGSYVKSVDNGVTRPYRNWGHSIRPVRVQTR